MFSAVRSTLTILSLLFLTLSCSSKPKVVETVSYASEIDYNDFQKILMPQNVVPLNDGLHSLVLMRGVGDEYSKIYLIDHPTRKMELFIDAGKSINYMVADPRAEEVFLMIDNKGDENLSIYAANLKTKKIKAIFGKEGHRSYIVDFSTDGNKIYMISNLKDTKVYQALEYDRQERTFSTLTPLDFSVNHAVVSQDGKYLATTSQNGFNYTVIHLVDLERNEIKKLIDYPGTQSTAAFFNPQLSWKLYINTNYQSDRMGCAWINLQAPQTINWLRKAADRDLDCHYDKSSQLSYINESKEARKHIYLFQGIFEKELLYNPLAKSMIEDVYPVPNKEAVIFKISSANSSPDLYFFNYQFDGRRLTSISQFNQSPYNSQNFGQAYDYFYKSFDNLPIQGILLAKEEWLSDGQKHPLIIWPHGGPDWMIDHSFNKIFQYFILNGYMIFAPNFRGSIGYGKKFEKMNNKDWGGAHIKDLIWGKRFMTQQSFVDPENIYIVGRSFGGYSTLSAITQYPTDFKAASAHIAFANLFTFMDSIPKDPWWQEEYKEEVGNPEEDKALIEERSPYFHVENIKIPLLIYQAENDIRTVKSEMDNFVLELNKYKIPHEYHVLKGEGHMFQKTSTWNETLAGTVEFLNRIRLAPAINTENN